MSRTMKDVILIFVIGLIAAIILNLPAITASDREDRAQIAETPCPQEYMKFIGKEVIIDGKRGIVINISAYTAYVEIDGEIIKIKAYDLEEKE